MSLKHKQFRTDKGRTVVFGPDPRTYPKSKYTLLDLPCREEVSQVFLEESSLGVRNIAFDSARPKQTSTLVFPPHGLARTPVSTPQDPIFFSGASLAGLRDVVPCKGRVGSLHAIIGLLLRYSDGREVSLGQVRLDRMDAPMSVSGRFSLWVGLSTVSFGQYAMAVDFSRGSDVGVVKWVEIRDDEWAEWWFSRQNSWVLSRRLGGFEHKSF